jgi:UDP-N-acetylmuramate dehydrogenase
MTLLSAWDAPVSRDVPLADLTWFGLGGPARFMASPASPDELAGLWCGALDAGMPFKVLGGGANVLISDDGFDGLVVRLDHAAFTAVDYAAAAAGIVTAGGGADLMKLSRECSRRGLAGLEAMAGIPGSAGGAVRMNAGGRFGSFSDAVRSADLVSPDGVVRRVSADELGFGYRQSELGGAIVVAVELALRPDDPARTYRRFREIWDYKRDSQPMADRSAGCIFKNPPGASAGALIDAAGLKGVRRGGACVSTRHANFIVAEPNARAADVIALIDQVREAVARRTGIELETEIDIWR